MKFVVTLAITVLSFAADTSAGAGRRPKRMLFGDLIHSFGDDGKGGLKSPYDAMYYSVGMKPSWGNVVYELEWDSLVNSWTTFLEEGPPKGQTVDTIRNTRCGGSFLTPRIVQTACHCVAHFFENKVADKFVWEEPLLIFATLKFNTARNWGVGYYSPKRYYAHRKCHRWSINQTRVISYDYGLISLAKGGFGGGYAVDSFPEPDSFRGAPLYTMQDLNMHYLNILKKQSVCLFIGHGYNKLDFKSGLMSIKPRKVYGRPVPRFIDVLPRHTWRTILGYRACHEFIEHVERYHQIVMADSGETPSDWHGWDVNIKKPLRAEEEVFHEAYTQDATFSCSMNAGKTQAVPTIGDGGYPVTCNNIYFAVAGLGWTRWNRMDRMSLQSPIAFTKWENSVEYRDNLRLKLTQWGPFERSKFKFKFAEHDSKTTGNTGSKPTLCLILLLAVPFHCFFCQLNVIHVQI